MKIGFTGSRDGMTNDQVLQVHMLLGDMHAAGASHATHGMCQGADEQFHRMAKALGYVIIGRPGVGSRGYAWKRANVECDQVMPVKFFLDRNRDIVAASTILIATPKETQERMRGSGTWATIRYARQIKLPICMVWPDGTGEMQYEIDTVLHLMPLNDYRTGLLRS